MDSRSDLVAWLIAYILTYTNAWGVEKRNHGDSGCCLFFCYRVNQPIVTNVELFLQHIQLSWSTTKTFLLAQLKRVQCNWLLKSPDDVAHVLVPFSELEILLAPQERTAQ